MADSWNNGIAEAVARMREHIDGKAPIKFDARDRAALNYILNTLEAREAKHAEELRDVFRQMRGYVYRAEDSSTYYGGGDDEDVRDEMKALADKLGVPIGGDGG